MANRKILSGYNDDGNPIIKTVSDEREAALQTVEAAQKKKDDAVAYKKKRVRAYPKLGDQFDVIWKQLAADKVSGKTLESEADAMLDTVKKVKTDIPKPE
jgi:hypothetical protein